MLKRTSPIGLGISYPIHNKKGRIPQIFYWLSETEQSNREIFVLRSVIKSSSILLDMKKSSLLWMRTPVIVNSRASRNTNIRTLSHVMPESSIVCEYHLVQPTLLPHSNAISISSYQDLIGKRF